MLISVDWVTKRRNVAGFHDLTILSRYDPFCAFKSLCLFMHFLVILTLHFYSFALGNQCQSLMLLDPEQILSEHE